MHLLIDDKDIILTDSIKIIYDQKNSQGNISLRIIDKIGNQVITELKYTKPKIIPPLEVDPTPFVEEEDYDYGLFLSNVVDDPDRKNRIYSG